MTISHLADDYIAAKWFHEGRVRPIRVIVVHDTESPEVTHGARNVARDFATRPATRVINGKTVSAKGSAHIVRDLSETIACVPEEDTAFAAPGANADGLQLELIGRAGQGAQGWADTYSEGVLDGGAEVCADWAARYAIPPVRLTVAELKDPNKRGFIGHIDATNAFHQSTHTDPGPTFPWDGFLRRVSGLLVPGATVPTPGSAGTVMLLPDGRIVELIHATVRHILTPAEVIALLAAGGGPQVTVTPSLAVRFTVVS